MDAKETSLVGKAISFARENSAYYKLLYRSVEQDEPDLEDLPFTETDEYWKLARANPANVMTGPLADGVAYCIGRSAGNLETAYLAKSEMKILSNTKAILWAKLLDYRKGDRVANVMTSRDLHVGFFNWVNLFSGMYNPADTPELLLSSEQPMSKIAEGIVKFEAKILFGTLSDLTRLAEHLLGSGSGLPSVRAVLYLGDALSRELHSVWREGFPNATLYAPLYSKLDMGPLGIADPITTCENLDLDPTYSVCEAVATLEIVADDGTVIKQPGVRGNVVITHLIRRLQPIIRYPVGDVAEWVDYELRTFKYHSMESTKIRLASTILDTSLVKSIVNRVVDADVGGRIQCVLRDGAPPQQLVIRLAYPIPKNPGQVRHDIEKELWKVSSEWQNDRKMGAIMSLRLDWVDDHGQLDYDEKTGRLREIVDERCRNS